MMDQLTNESVVSKIRNLREIRLLEQVKPFYDVFIVIFSVAIWPLLVALYYVYVQRTYVGSELVGPLWLMIFATPIIILLLIVSFILSITLIFRGYNQRARYKEENQKLWDKYIQKTGFYYKPRAKKIWIIFLVIMVGLIMAITIYSSFNQHEKASFLEKKENVIMTFLAKNYPEAKFYDITPSNNYLEKGKTHYFRVKSKKYLGHYFSVDVTKENIVNLNEADLKKAKQDLLFREKYFNNFDMNKMIFNFYLNGVIGYINVKENPQQLLEFLIKVFEIYHNINDPQKVYIKINLIDLPEQIDRSKIKIPFDWWQFMYYDNGYAIKYTWGLVFITDCKSNPISNGCDKTERENPKYSELAKNIKNPLDIAQYFQFIPRKPVRYDSLHYGEEDSWAIRRRAKLPEAKWLMDTPGYQQIKDLYHKEKEINHG